MTRTERALVVLAVLRTARRAMSRRELAPYISASPRTAARVIEDLQRASLDVVEIPRGREVLYQLRNRIEPTCCGRCGARVGGGQNPIPIGSTSRRTAPWN